MKTAIGIAAWGGLRQDETGYSGLKLPEALIFMVGLIAKRLGWTYGSAWRLSALLYLPLQLRS
jgi:hypothetical protein